MKDKLAEEMRRASTDKVATFHPTAADRLLQGAAYIESLEAKLEKAREALEMIAGHQRDAEYSYEDDYFGCRTIAFDALKEISQ